MFILANNLSFSYSGNTIFRNINFMFKGPGLFIIKGKNGSGKTTLLKILGGILQQSSGKLSINGVDNKKYPDYPLYFSSLLSSPINFNEDTLLNILESLKIPIKNTLIQQLQINLTSKYSLLSEGEKDKFRLYIANFSKGIVLLDEPSKSMDTLAITNTIELLTKLKHYKLIVLSTNKDIFDSLSTKSINIEENRC